ncbi:hypothetical protein ASPZODRAFT_59014 [Penicilliopsis zonata CBS 506.65]|uniref:[acyl-carrier-protein] S-malonyltransferase n=1 Tax=Penicilliopsis zonata CBS 506.65 TaxID=1073090 RepID=A0A1L9SQX3_9EURO|nr:hypothetical protein ASPZODRAFT_59014 [Penicilliopsis zonata CBS 506.65]OJJ49503.1 hypothetical protein ASPZODRAFT_59014 [Penicilliopsis zonata CBS 506.65]
MSYHIFPLAKLSCLKPHTITRNLRTALFFPGHGVQRVGMIDSWIERFPNSTRHFLNEMDDILGYRLSRIICDGPNSLLNQTENSQPAIMATSLLILRLLEIEFGFNTRTSVDVTLGHSLGEFSALVAGGYIQFRDALRLVQRRAEIMAQCTHEASEKSGENYGMIALICEPEHLDALLKSIYEFLDFQPNHFDNDNTGCETTSIRQVMVANINSRNQIVLSGSIEKIKTLLIQLRQFGGHDPRAVKLKSESPFHNPIMTPAADYMRDALEKIQITYPKQIACISNVSGLPFKSETDIKDLLSQQCISTVRWWDSIKFLDRERGIRSWIGLGPGKVGRNLVGKEVGRVQTKGDGVWAICAPQDVEDVLLALDQI